MVSETNILSTKGPISIVNKTSPLVIIPISWLQFQIFVMRIFKPWLIIDFFYKILGYKAQVRKNRAIQKDFIEKIIQAAKEKIIKEQQLASCIVPKLKTSGFGNKGTTQPSPFVEQVLKDKMNTGKYHDHDLSHSELLHEMVTLLNAGFDTVTITISVILNILALHPNLQQDVSLFTPVPLWEIWL